VVLVHHKIAGGEVCEALQPLTAGGELLPLLLISG
jgi:hypothetical protein